MSEHEPTPQFTTAEFQALPPEHPGYFARGLLFGFFFAPAFRLGDGFPVDHHFDDETLAVIGTDLRGHSIDHVHRPGRHLTEPLAGAAKAVVAPPVDRTEEVTVITQHVVDRNVLPGPQVDFDEIGLGARLIGDGGCRLEDHAQSGPDPGR